MSKYERVEVTFNKDSKVEMELYEYLVKQSEIVGKGKYIKLLIQKEKNLNPKTE